MKALRAAWRLIVLSGALVALAGLLVVTVLVAPLLMLVEWRARRAGHDFKPEPMR